MVEGLVLAKRQHRSSKTEGERTMAKEKVLIIEDRRENLVFLANQVLRPNGYEVITATDGEAGLGKALTERPDLIVMDFRMPKMTGIEVLRALNKAEKDIPVIMATFHGSEELVIEAFRLGAKDYLIKPYEVEQMLDAVDRALASSRRFREEKVALQDDVDRTGRQLERRVKELNILSGIGKAVTSLHDLEMILQRIVEAATYLTGAEEAFLMLVDGDSGELYMRAVQGMGKKYQRFRQKVDDSIAGQVVRTGRPVRIGRDQKDGAHEVVTGYLVQDLLNVPLKVHGEVIGVLGVNSISAKGSFSEGDEYLLSAVADYAAIAIDNARLYELMDQRAHEMTKMIASQTGAQSDQQQALAEQARRLEVREKRLLDERDQIVEATEELGSLYLQLKALGARIAERV
jgi:two-component system NtrC family sensor kinase